MRESMGCRKFLAMFDMFPVCVCVCVCIKGQLGVPLTVYPWYLLGSLGILGDTHKYPRAIGLI